MKQNSTFTLAAVLVAGALLATGLRAENPQFREQLAAWQSPRGGQSVRPAAYAEEAPAAGQQSRFARESVESWTGEPGWESGGDGGGACGDCGRGACRPDWDWCGNKCGPRMWWIRKEGLIFWRKGRDLPPLVTSSDQPVPPAGTEVLFGGQTQTSNAKIGGRIDFGTWVTYDECVGIGGRFWGLQKDQTTFALSSADFTSQTIERPFTDSSGPNSLVIADPFTGFGGNIRITSSSDVYGADAYVRIRCGQSCMSRTDFVTGYQFTRINESLQIHSDTQNGTLIVNDNYSTRNEFHGGVLGVLHETACGCLNLQLLARVGLGNMRQTAIATGTTNGQTGGLYVEQDQTLVRDQFCAVPEFGVTLGYQISPCTEVHAGYTYLGWSKVTRPEDNIDGVRGDSVSLAFRESNFWVQGLTAGLTYRW
jgi:hypothetical protein